MTSDVPGAVIDEAVLTQLIRSTGDDLDFVAELVDEFASDGAAQVASMRGAVARRDAAALTRAAHALKSTAAAFGAVALSARCRALEADARGGVVTDAPAAIDEVDASLRAVVAVLSARRDQEPT